jgi:hypothetical protein
MLKTLAEDGATTCVSISSWSVLVAPGLRHRAVPNSGASWRALMAVQAAVSVGIVPARPAAAQTVLTNSSSTVYLSDNGGIGNNPFSIAAGTVIEPATGDGIVGNLNNVYSLTNTGGIYANNSIGVDLLGSGDVINTNATFGGRRQPV